MEDVLKELSNITARGYSPSRVFSDWLYLMMYALMRDDEKYLKIVHEYRNDRPNGQREIDYFKNAFHLLMNRMAQEERDILGELYMTWEVSNKYAGQFFTPWHIARFMAEITKPTGGTVNDCSCGSGVMLVAAALSMKKEQRFATVFVGQDLDSDCVAMCALNFVFFNLNGYVIQGNTLAKEHDRAYGTRHTALGGDIHEIDVSLLPKMQEHGQTSLFAA